MKKSKALLACLTSVIIIASMFTGCDSSTNTNINKATVDSSQKSTSSSEKITLTLWSSKKKEDLQVVATDKLINKFNSSQDKIEVKLEWDKNIATDIKVMPDIAIVDNPNMAALADVGLLADITNKMNAYEHKDDFYPGPIASCMLNGKYYGIPLGSNDLALYYNKDMFEAAGLKPPTTFNELKNTAKKLTRDNTYGFAIAAPNYNYETTTFQYMPFLISQGAQYNGVSSEEGISALNFLTDFLRDGSMSKEIMDWEQSDLTKQFIANKVAMMVNGPWSINMLKNDAPNLKWGVVKIPREKKYSSVLGGENWAIFKGKNEDAVWEFIKFTQEEEVLNEFCSEQGYIPSRKDIAERNEEITKDPNMSVFLDELQYASQRGPHKNWPKISNAIANAVQESFTKAKTPEQAAKDAQAKIDALLK